MRNEAEGLGAASSSLVSSGSQRNLRVCNLNGQSFERLVAIGLGWLYL